MIRDVSDLEVYQESLNLLEDLYQVLRKVPSSEYDSIRQAKRSTKSIAPNIAEGFAKRSSEKEFKRYLSIALASCDETITHLRQLFIVCSSPNLKTELKSLGQRYKTLSKRINRLKTNWKS